MSTTNLGTLSAWEARQMLDAGIPRKRVAFLAGVSEIAVRRWLTRFKESKGLANA